MYHYGRTKGASSPVHILLDNEGLSLTLEVKLTSLNVHNAKRALDVAEAEIEKVKEGGLLADLMALDSDLGFARQAKVKQVKDRTYLYTILPWKPSGELRDEALKIIKKYGH